MVLERKTTGSKPNDDYWSRLPRTLQTRLYSKIAYDEGLTDTKSVLYEVCEKPRIRPRRGRGKERAGADTPETYHDRCVEHVHIHRRVIDPAGDDPYRELSERIMEANWRKEGKIYPCVSAACQPIGGGRCEYADLCFSGYSAMVRDRYYMVDDYRGDDV